MKTHSYEDLPFSTASSVSDIVFSPSSGIAEQNTLLMEHPRATATSCSVSRTPTSVFTTYADGPAFPSASSSWTHRFRRFGDEIAARADAAGTPLERASIRLEYFERGTRLTELMGIWVRDLTFLLDAITNEGDAPPLAARIDTGRIGLMGMSYGGGAVTELCKLDSRCRAAMNMDGGLWGSRTRQAPTVPYLALASPNNAPFLSTAC
jgi:hypothetical protein